ncbi:hypothetical protein B4U79_00874, partial [Dinothrombium tinctorium]
AYLNVCFPYTSRHEIAEAITKISEGVQKGALTVSDIDEQLLEECLYTNRSPDPELIIRTSGEVRLSDFLLWQSSFSVLAFVDVLWPTFSFWDFCYAIFYYQRHHKVVEKAREEYLKQRFELEEKANEEEYFLNEEINLENCKTTRSKRISEFLINLENSDLQRIRELIEPVSN